MPKHIVILKTQLEVVLVVNADSAKEASDLGNAQLGRMLSSGVDGAEHMESCLFFKTERVMVEVIQSEEIVNAILKEIQDGSKNMGLH